jgi:Uma2 family endonuclease
MSATLSAPEGAETLAVPPVPIWRLSVAQYHRMIETGILTGEDPVELLEGWLVVRMLKKPAHRLATRLARTALERAIPPGWFVDAQEPITTESSEPEPDVALIRGDPADYRERHPAPADVGLVVEVSGVTLQRARLLKKRIYAGAGIPRYWILNLVTSTLETHAKPSGGAAEPDYSRQETWGVEDEVPLVLDGREVARLRVRDLFP